MEGNDSLRDALTAAFAKAKDSDAPAEPSAPETVATPETPPPEKPPASSQTATARPRDERGRFVSVAESGDEKAPEKPVEPPSDQTAAAVEPEKAPETPKAGKAPAPPIGWSAEAKARWHELPPEVQAAIVKREQDAAKLTGKMDEERAFGRELRSVIQPYLPLINAEGATPAQAVQALLNTAYILRSGSPEQKRAALMQVAQQYNVPLFSGEGQPSGSNEIMALRQQVQQLQAQLQQYTHGVEQQSIAAVQQDIQAFAADPAHSYFEEVKGHMAALLRSGAAKDLQDAYDQACWARPDIRETLLAQQRAEAEQKRRAEEQKRAEEARRKAISLSGAPGVVAPGKPNGNLSLREEITQNLRSVMNRGAV